MFAVVALFLPGAIHVSLHRSECHFKNWGFEETFGLVKFDGKKGAEACLTEEDWIPVMNIVYNL